MNCSWIWKKVNKEAEQEYRYKRDPYEFAMNHLWQPKFVSMSNPALFAFSKELGV